MLEEGAQSAVIVNRRACERLASLLRELHIPPDREDRTPALSTSNDSGNFYLLLVAICHQTQSLEGTVEARKLRGWDYLTAKLREGAQLDEDFLSPQRWQRMTPGDLQSIVSDGDSALLTSPDRRAELIRDLGARMDEKGWARFKDLYEQADRRIGGTSPNLLELLAGFEAYKDPVKKKSMFLLGLMRNTEGWRYADDESLGPPVDYHEVRGHLRIGTVQITDPALRDRLLHRQPVTEAEDVAIRLAVYQAILYIASREGTPDTMRLHYLFWNIFRAVCLRDAPHCRAYPSTIGSLPERYIHLTRRSDGSTGCPFGEVCTSIDKDQKFLEHVFATDWY